MHFQNMNNSRGVRGVSRLVPCVSPLGALAVPYVNLVETKLLLNKGKGFGVTGTRLLQMKVIL